jgi:hypothetical protein
LKIFIIPHPALHFNPLYTCPRGEAIVLQGLRVNPEVELVNKPEDADYYILDYVPHDEGEKWATRYLEKYFDKDKLIIIDWVDEHDKYLVPLDKCYLYFKRSWLTPDIQVGENAICVKSDHHFRPGYLETQLFPISYAILDEFPRNFTPFAERSIDVGCYLRFTCPNRTMAKCAAIQAQRNILSGYNFHIDEVSGGSRSVGSNVYVDNTYFDYLGNTKINITCNPTWWVGDSRLWESLVSGCLTFCDYNDVPDIDNLGGSVFWYLIDDMKWLFKDLRANCTNVKKAEEFARAGQEFALKNHSSAARMKYVIDRIKWRKEYDEHLL